MPAIPFLFSQLCLPYSYSSIHHRISFHIPFPNSNQPTQYEWPAVQEGAFLFISRYAHLLRGALLSQLSVVYKKWPLTCGFKKTQFRGSNKHTSVLLQFWRLEERNVLQWAQIKVSAQPGSLQKRKPLSQFLELPSCYIPWPTVPLSRFSARRSMITLRMAWDPGHFKCYNTCSCTTSLETKWD